MPLAPPPSLACQPLAAQEPRMQRGHPPAGRREGGDYPRPLHGSADAAVRQQLRAVAQAGRLPLAGRLRHQRRPAHLSAGPQRSY